MTDRPRLSRERVLGTAVALADDIGIEALSMRRLATQLEVVPMALYKHVANKEALLDGMVETVIIEIGPPRPEESWKAAVRGRVLAARKALQRHPWARSVVETRSTKTGAVLDYINSFAGLLLAGGLSPDLAHHAMHAIGGRMWGFTQELFEEVDAAAAPSPEQIAFIVSRFPHIATIATATVHDPETVAGSGCDDQFEFEFALDLLLDGIERLHEQGWRSAAG